MRKCFFLIAALFCVIATPAFPRAPVWICDNMDVCPDGTTSVTGGGTVPNPKGKFDDEELSFEEWLQRQIDSIIGTNGIIGGG